MNKLLAILAVVLGLSPSLAHAAPPDNAPWVLLGLDINMGAVTVRDTAKDADTTSIYGEGLPVFETAAACQAALRHSIQKYAALSHAEGNYGRFLCTNWRTWATVRAP